MGITSHLRDTAHTILERRISGLLFIGQFEVRVKRKQATRKALFKSIDKNLLGAFHWREEDKAAFATYVDSNGWTVVRSLTEPELQIARKCQEGDIVVTTDSDLLAYKSVKTIWRTISSYNILEYDLDDILKHLEPSRAQLTALGVDSSIMRRNKGVRTYAVPLKKLRAMFEKNKELRQQRVKASAGAGSAGSGDHQSRFRGHPKQAYNRFQATEPRTQRPRYSFKTRERIIKHASPE
ncbi:hypothetical protein BCR41DRAFT_420389 [Lobosporangium transversale]|uniref:Uncharacterized protein n=1 Tax=Lobosporangium transversale TaxID=64571 RepID=A0A1Y2GUE2_9FUNG|nr:hypothetical protein BCR41DRAFT_420389 [Lobosporangium transversale]ORZ23841.1 hypothetical protein BCR41DRAFT_420389 [Lobosporangium transversale]|eukprot:XP_021883655.1 hypothetical protein BCR41DRAFT_420389 [Lobosporangium transversale]